MESSSVYVPIRQVNPMLRRDHMQDRLASVGTSRDRPQLASRQYNRHFRPPT